MARLGLPRAAQVDDTAAAAAARRVLDGQGAPADARFGRRAAAA